MAERSAIEWTDATFNPWWGCQKVSPACDHCYAERDAHRFAPGRVLWGAGAERRTFGDAHWQQPLAWAKRPIFECADCGLRGDARAMGDDPRDGCKHANARPARRRVFCASMADWLDLDAPLDQFVRLLDTIRRTPELDWLLLSKRIGNWRKRLEEAFSSIAEPELATWVSRWLGGFPPANVWLGSTVIDQAEADRDVPKLLAVPARVRFLSIEPMLGDIRLGSWLQRSPSAAFEAGKVTPDMPAWTRIGSTAIDWVICGGESGPHARPMHPDWARSLRDQCAAAGVPFLFKQWGEWIGADQDACPIGPPASRWRWGDGTPYSYGGSQGKGPLLCRAGKKAAGRVLDGRTHDGFPVGVAA